MKKISLIILLSISCILANAQALIQIDPTRELRPIGPMHGVGGGPASFVSGKFYKAAGIPFVRLHDVGNSLRHTVEVMQLFPDFDADETKAENYDFTITDEYITNLVNTGAEIIWRLGNAGHEPTSLKKYGAWPPKDFKKWARICSHIVAHYNEGWADGFHYNIKYWEIWNEPDGDQAILKKSEKLQEKDKDKVGNTPRYQVSPHSWGGTMEEYYEFFATAAKYLKKEHPSIMIGGPANAEFEYNEPFLKAMAEKGVKLDFFTWHRYSRTPERLSKEGKEVRELLDKYGYQGLPTILDEWNYVTAWDAESGAYSSKVRNSLKGAAYTAACFCHMQCEACTDILTYYDWRHNTSYNGAFDKQTHMETSTYYVFYNWNKLREYGTQVGIECHQKDIYSVAAKSPEGKVRLMAVRFNDNDGVYGKKSMFVPMPQGCSKFRVLVSDENHMNCECPHSLDKNKRIKLEMTPNCVYFLEFE